MRDLPPVRRIDVTFGELTFAATATIGFTYADGSVAAPDRHITVEAGRRGTWTIAFTPREALPAGSEIVLQKVENEFRFAWRHQDYWPDARDYVTVEDGQGNALPFVCDTMLKSKVAALITLPREMAAGEQIVVRLGDRRQGGVGSVTWPARYERAHIEVGVRLPGEETFRRAPEALLAVHVVPCPPVKRYHLFAPSVAEPGKPFRVVALPMDINGNVMPPGEDVAILGPEGPTRGRRDDMDSIQAQVVLAQPELTRLRLTDETNGISAVSNPIRVSPDPDYRLYWGEFHWHGYDAVEINVLNPDTHPDKAFRYGRDVTRLDFAGVGSHIFRQAPHAVHEWWEPYRAAALKYDEEGRYIPFLGCEWRDRELEGGDRNIIWRDLDAPAPDPTWKIARLYEMFRGQPVMMTPHVGGAIAMPYHYDPQVETLCEMTSGHGNFEWFAQAYLSKGYRVGLIGGSDGHRGTPGHPRMVSMDGGRFVNILRLRDAGWYGGPPLAVYARGLDRASLWEAFRARRTYASTGARALVEFRANGAIMGSEISADRDVKIEITVEGTAPIERVDLIRDQSRRERWEGNGRHFVGTLVDRPPDGVHYYYLRIEQADGEMLWSSPIWVRSRCGGADAGLPAWNAPEEIDLAAIGDNPASQYLDDLWRYLRTEENAAAFSQLTPLKIVHSPMGDYAVFLGYMAGRRIRIHWFYEFEVPRIRLEIGWAQYGQERIVGAPWARPLFANQDRMG